MTALSQVFCPLATFFQMVSAEGHVAFQTFHMLSRGSYRKVMKFTRPYALENLQCRL